MASADIKPPSGDEALTSEEKERIMGMVPDPIKNDDKTMGKATLQAQLRHTALVNALNHLKKILEKDTPGKFYDLKYYLTIIKNDNGQNIMKALDAYNNNGFSNSDYYGGITSIESFYKANTDLNPIPPEVIKAYSLDKFEKFAHEYEYKHGWTAVPEDIIYRNGLDPWRGGGRFGKSRSSKKRTTSAKRKSAKRSKRPRRRRSNRRTSRK